MGEVRSQSVSQSRVAKLKAEFLHIAMHSFVHSCGFLSVACPTVRPPSLPPFLSVRPDRLCKPAHVQKEPGGIAAQRGGRVLGGGGCGGLEGRKGFSLGWFYG